MRSTVTELLVSARAVHVGLEEMKPFMMNETTPYADRIVIGSVAGDLHDLGKNIVFSYCSPGAMR